MFRDAVGVKMVISTRIPILIFVSELLVNSSFSL